MVREIGEGEPLIAVVDHLARHLGSGDAARAVAESEGPWTARLEHALAAVGVRTQWMAGPPGDAAALARPDLPVVGRADLGTWWLLDDQQLGRVRARPLADPRAARWMTVRQLEEQLGSSVRRWALVEPALPATPLADPDGHSGPWARLRALVRVERSEIGVVVAFAVAVGLCSLATPLAVQVLINWLAFGGLLQPVVVLGLALAVFLALGALLSVLQRVAVEAIERRLFARVVADLAARMSRVRLPALDGADGPAMANRFFDVLTIQKAAGSLLLEGTGAALQLAVAVALLAVYHPWLLVFDLVLLVGMIAVLAPHVRAAERTSIRESDAKYEAAAWIEEIARHPLAMRLGGGDLAEARAHDVARRWLDRRADHFRVFLRQLVGARVLQVLASAALLITSGSLVLRGELTLGQLVAAEFIVTAALGALVKFTDKLDALYDLLAGLYKLGGLLDLPPEPAAGSRARAEAGARQLRGVAVRDLAPIDLDIRPGDRVALLARPGAARSELGEVLVGGREPASGAVLRQGEPLQGVAPDVRYREALLLRPDAVLSASVRDNVTVGRSDRPDADVWAALARAGVADRVRALPHGLDTALGPTGRPLDPGDARRILVARAWALRPSVLVVDGLLDDPAGDGLLEALGAVDAPWTLLTLTADPAVAARHPVSQPVGGAA